LAEAVVDVERADRLRPPRPHREVEHADRVAAAGDHRQQGTGTGEQAARLDPLQQLLADHAARTTNSSVGSGNPFSLTSPIGSNSRRRLPAIAPQTLSVTRTSPARARLTTRWTR